MTSLSRRWITLSLCLAAALSGCRSDAGERASIHNQIEALTSSTSETIDLSQVGSSSWSRLCVLTPYSTNETAKNVLGFEWDAEKKTSIQSSDSITVLIFASDGDVETYVAYPRENGDFSRIESSCLSRDRAKFVREQNDGSVSFVVAD